MATLLIRKGEAGRYARVCVWNKSMLFIINLKNAGVWRALSSTMWPVAKTGSRSSNSDEVGGTYRKEIEKAVLPVSAFLVSFVRSFGISLESGRIDRGCVT